MNSGSQLPNSPLTTMTSTIGIPIKLLNEATVRLPSTHAQMSALTLLAGPHRHHRTHLWRCLPRKADRRSVACPSTQRILLTEAIAEDNMNVQLIDVQNTSREGRVSHLERVYVRGSHIRYFIVPDMLRNAPMFRQKDKKGRGVGLARGRATVSRARGQRGGPGPRGA